MIRAFRYHAWGAVALLLVVTACQNVQPPAEETTTPSTSPKTTNTPGIFTADTVTAAPGHTGSGTGDSNKAVNGVRGAGCGSGSFDVFSLNYSGGTYITLEWSGKKVTNGPGIDFVVFENAFFTPNCSSSTRFMDLVVVEVSQDGSNWCGFNPDYTNADENTYSNLSTPWERFAGKTPVLYNADTNPLDAAQLFADADNDKEMDNAGGDGFDLDDLSSISNSAGGSGCSTALVSEIQNNGFIYVKLSSAAALTNPDTGSAFVRDAISNGPDIDGVIARYTEPR